MAILGIDIGGTSIKGGLVYRYGQVDKLFSLPIDKELSQEEQIEALIKKIKETYNDNEFEGIGLGIPGAIDNTLGVVMYSNNLKWENLPIGRMLKHSFPGKKVAMTNDANAAALGEAKFGSAKNEQDVVMITLGTGIGSGIIINGKLYEGNHGRGAELGHQVLVLDGIPCTCGRKGCFEMYASATALVRQANEAIKENPECKLALIAKNGEEVNGKLIFETAKAGCTTAQKVVDNYIKYLGEGLINICNVFRPSSIVLSGGIANQGDYLLNKLVAYLEKEHYGYLPEVKVEIKIASLGYNSGIIGAATLLLK
ncbi:MAG: ROK family protein [Bacilli bacterium]|nr:ROK family protein [Bacilli bacterium]